MRQHLYEFQLKLSVLSMTRLHEMPRLTSYLQESEQFVAYVSIVMLRLTLELSELMNILSRYLIR